LDLRDLESVLHGLDAPASDFARIDDVEPDGKVLVVHGRNYEVREQVARFLMKLALQPILLDEQAAHGRTLIEKLESQTGLSFAVVILTGDDVGALATD